MKTILALAACLALTFGSARAEDTKVAIGIVPASDFVPLMIAKDKGFLGKQGIDGTITVIPLISNIPAGIVSGSLQIGATTGPIFLQAQENGLDLVAIAGASRWLPESQTSSLMLVTGSSVKDPKDLAGKRIAVPGLNSLMDLIFRRWLVTKGLQPTALTEVEASFPVMGDLLRGHQVEAAMVIEPFRDAVLTSNAGTRMANVAQEVNPNIVAAFYIADRKWAADHGKEVAGFRAALRQGIDFFQHDPEGKAIEAKYLRVNSKVVPTFDLTLTPDDLRFHQDLAKEFKLLEGKADPKTLILP